MISLIERHILRVQSRFFRFYSTNVDTLKTNSRNSQIEDFNELHEDEDFIKHNLEVKGIRREEIKSLRIAILGLPNVGKSTLVNQLVGRPVCAMSSKVHATRSKSDAIITEDETQLVFIDTPGLVTNHELKKFKLESSFKTDITKALGQADVVGVVQDASNPFYTQKIDERILVCLKMIKPNVTSILILNKVDKLKKKHKLLDLVDLLTGEKNWPHFSDVFMISALQADGIDDLRNYLLTSAKSRDWDYDAEITTPEPREKIIERAVRSKFMDALPNELPYLIKFEIEHYAVLEDDTISVVVSVSCPTDRISKLVMGSHGSRVKLVAYQAEQELSQAFRTTVRMNIAIKFKDPEYLAKNMKKRHSTERKVIFNQKT